MQPDKINDVNYPRIADNTTIDFNPADRGQADRIEAFEYWTVNSGNVNNTAMYDQH